MHVLKGKKMAGQMGNVKRTVQNLEVVSIDKENNLILIKGNVPGPKKSLVVIYTSVKKGNQKAQVESLVTYQEEKIDNSKENVVEETVSTDESSQA